MIDNLNKNKKRQYNLKQGRLLLKIILLKSCYEKLA